MINQFPPLTMTLRSVVVNGITCSLLMLPCFAMAQGFPETPDEPAVVIEPGTIQPGTIEPEPIQSATDEPTIVITPGATGSASKSEVPGSTSKPEVPGSTSKPEASGSASKPEVPGSTSKPEVPGSTSKPEASGSATKPQDLGSGAKPQVPTSGSGTKNDAGTKENATVVGDGTSLEERRAAWMAGLKKLTFAELVQKIREDERQIDQYFIHMPIGYPQKQAEFERSIQGLQGEVIVLTKLLEPAAVEAFRSDPIQSQAAAKKVFELLSNKLSPGGRQFKYDPEGGLKLVDKILEIKGGNIGMEAGVPSVPEDEPFLKVIYQGYLACYGLQDFERADQFLTRLENAVIGLSPQVRETFQLTVDAWEKEKLLRAEEERANDLPRVKLETTDGDVIIELVENEAPNTVANFIKLVKEEYYDGLEFFHVVPSGYARTGCTANDGTTNPGYRIRNEFENGRQHFAGTVMMQNDGENTAGAQFAILHQPDPNLLGRAVAFGRVIQGLDVIYQFHTVNRIRTAGGDATIVNKATVVRDRGHDYVPEMLDESAAGIGGGSDTRSGGSNTRSGGSSTRSSGSGARPSSSSTRPSGSSQRPIGSSVPSSGSGSQPSGSRSQPSGSGQRP